MISDRINNIIPHFIPFFTIIVWCPWNVASRKISRHHWIIDKMIIIKEIFNKLKFIKWNIIIKPDVKVIAPIELVIGHGLFSTRWKGWNDIS